MKDFREEFNKIVNLIETQNSFVFVRYGDGEVYLMEGKTIGKHTQAHLVDKWESSGFSKLGKELTNSIKNSDWYYGIPCKCCNEYCKNYLIKLINVPNEQFTYANLWANANYPLFLDWIKKINSEVVLIANKEAQKNLNKFPFRISEFFPIQDDCVNFYEKNSETLIEQLKSLSSRHQNKIFFVSAGPLSEVMINFLYNFNKYNKYVDVGSSLDEFTHQRTTRPYMIKGSMYNQKVCNF
jgi:hypothetical protein